jgi:hypothetical protein
MTKHTLEPAAPEIAGATSKPPFLYEAGVRTTSVRFNGTLHDFLMLSPVRGMAGTTAALKQAIHVLRQAPGTS